MTEVDALLTTYSAAVAEMINRLRGIVRSAHPTLTERVKWNAPSYASGGDDRITLGVERKGGVRLVLHRGAKPLPTNDFAFEDHDGLARWLAPDRGVIILNDQTAIERSAESLTDLCRRWVDYVDGS